MTSKHVKQQSSTDHEKLKAVLANAQKTHSHAPLREALQR